MHTIHEITYLSPEYDEEIKLRDRVLREPLNMQFSEAQLEAEFDQIHLGAFDSCNRLRGCLVLKKSDDSILQMRQVAVDPDFQNQGIGAMLVHAAEAWAVQNGYRRIMLHARDVAKRFYEKLEYHVEGDSFIEINIEHFQMYKDFDRE
ncbi:MAG: GNAT family N-acetyltransferase [Saprospiraceae bacterium]|nr:GNAT family N-acetyltransferase [Saprospiraceae bacterium]